MREGGRGEGREGGRETGREGIEVQCTFRNFLCPRSLRPVVAVTAFTDGGCGGARAAQVVDILQEIFHSKY